MKIYTQDQIQEVSNALMMHHILAFPTDTVYGVGVMYGDLNDLQRLKKAKHRPETKPIPMMVSDISQMKEIAVVDERTQKIADRFLPGPLTMVLPAKDTLHHEYTDGLKTVAVRIPEDDFILQVIRYLQRPLLVSSANQSGQSAAVNYRQALSQLPNIDGVVLGVCKEKQASTIVDCTQSILKIVREGPISLEQLCSVCD